VLVTSANYGECVNRVRRSDDLVLDLETNGLVPWKGDHMIGTAVEPGDGGEPVYFPFRHGGGGNLPFGPEALLGALAPRPGRLYRGWQARFDMTMLSYEPNGDRFLAPDVMVHDGIIDALVMNENEAHFSLGAIADKYLGQGAGGTKDAMEKLLAERFPDIKSAKDRKGNLWRLGAEETEIYACGDVTLPRRLAAVYEPAVEKWGLTETVEEMNAYSLLLARVQKRGILIDHARCKALSDSTAERKAGLLDAIRQEVGDEKFNPNSPLQVPKLLGTTDAREATLKQVDGPQRGLAQHIIDFKKLGKAKSAYYDAILNLMDSDNVLHPQLNLTRDPSDAGGTRTSRLSCSMPNFQALPHVNEDPNAIYQVRDLVLPRPGFKIAKMDYERAEMWMGASYCKEPALIRAYLEKRDIYQEMADALSITRHHAKILFLMLQYGAGAWKVAQFFGWPFKTVKQMERVYGPTSGWGFKEWDEYTSQKSYVVRAGFFDLYPCIKEAMQAYSASFEEHGYLRLWTDRVIHFDPSTTPAYAAWNRLIQGAVGEMVRLAMQRLEPMLAQYDAHMLLQVHDELLIEYPEGKEAPVLKLCKYVMEDFDFALKPRVEIKTSAINYARVA